MLKPQDMLKSGNTMLTNVTKTKKDNLTVDVLSGTLPNIAEH
jgi:hypothetical protein